MNPLLRGLLVCFTVVRCYWLYLTGAHVYKLLDANLVGPAILWLCAFFGVWLLFLACKTGFESE